jgi:DNA-binding HxlR family transcriptional regulator
MDWGKVEATDPLGFEGRKLRFSELRRKVPGATQKVLTEQWRQLEASGVIQSSTLAGSKLHTEYCLSAYGATLRPVLAALAEWGACDRERRQVNAFSRKDNHVLWLLGYPVS